MPPAPIGAHDHEDANGGDAPTTRRLTVLIGPHTERALHQVATREGVTITEAVRRLVGYGAHLYRASDIDGAAVFIRRQGTETERIRIIA